MAALFLALVLGTFAAIRSATWTSTAPTSSPPAATASTVDDDVDVRIRNDSNVEFDNVDVSFFTCHTDYGRVAPGAISEYHVPSGRAYRIALIKVRIDDRTVSYSPVDYVGEQQLAPGHYTYVLTLTGDTLRLTFQIDP